MERRRRQEKRESSRQGQKISLAVAIHHSVVLIKSPCCRPSASSNQWRVQV